MSMPKNILIIESQSDGEGFYVYWVCPDLAGWHMNNKGLWRIAPHFEEDYTQWFFATEEQAATILLNNPNLGPWNEEFSEVSEQEAEALT